jgi:GT2 family glycosyltransferase
VRLAMDPPRASIVVVTSVNAKGLESCLLSIAAHAAPEVPFETIVVLNGAEDSVRAVVHRAHKSVKVVQSPVNRGFAGGCNLGRTAAKGEFIVLLHDDSEVEEGWLTELVRCADEHSQAGAVGARVLHPDGRLQLAGAVLWRDATTTAVGPDNPDGYLECRPVDYAGTSVLLVRVTTWDAIGGMDERFYPAYFADVDMAMSIRRLGQVVLYEPRSRIRHHTGASSSSRFKAFVGPRNRELFRTKWARELELHEERSETLDRALERTRLEAERLRVAPPPPAPPPPNSKAEDPADAELRFLRMDGEFREAYAAELKEELAGLQAAGPAKESELAEVYAELERVISRRAAPSRTG